MKRFLLALFLFTAPATLQAASLLEGRIYMKNGSVIECTGNDRLKMPKKSGRLKLFRDAFQKTKTKEVLPAGDIDSVICWHTKSPEHTRKFIFGAKPVDTN